MKAFDFKLTDMMGEVYLCVKAENKEAAELKLKELIQNSNTKVEFLGEVKNNVIEIDFIKRKRIA